jgi:hypothetical protein
MKYWSASMQMVRLTIRPRYDAGRTTYQVVDGVNIVGRYDLHGQAVEYIAGRDAALRLVWARTVIGGETGQYDFSARYREEIVGRIYRYNHGPAQGQWFWTMNAIGGYRSRYDVTGMAKSKDEAVFRTERAYVQHLAYKP